MDRPNIIFLNTDQHSWDAFSFFGNHAVQTPNLDRLFSNGISFNRMYATNPVCTPARSSWATGLYTTETGCTYNFALMHEDILDIGQIMRDGGYEAYHAGKWHVDGRDVKKSFNSLYYGNEPISAGGGEFYDSATSRAVSDFITNRKSDKPFYLQIGLINPHDICEFGHSFEIKETPDGVEQGFLSEDELPPLPENFNYDHTETFVQIAFRRNKNALIHPNTQLEVLQWSENQWRYFAWMYYRFVERVDAEIAVILAAIESSDLKENTIIIFSSDHGEACGRHRMFQKFTLYEESVRVPFAVASFSEKYNINKNKIDYHSLISGVDIFATICDYAGVKVPERTHGKSIRPIIEGETSNHRDFIFIENNYWERAIINNDYKLIVEYVPNKNPEFTPPSPNTNTLGRMQLFNLKNDPMETKNIVKNKDNRLLIEKMLDQLKQQEKQLFRRPICPGEPREILREYHSGLTQTYKHYEKDNNARCCDTRITS